MTIPLHAVIVDALHRGASLREMANILRSYRDDGGSAVEALRVLEALRKELSDEEEDRVLEVMDLATGFCADHLRVWPREPGP